MIFIRTTILVDYDDFSERDEKGRKCFSSLSTFASAHYCQTCATVHADSDAKFKQNGGTIYEVRSAEYAKWLETYSDIAVYLGLGKATDKNNRLSPYIKKETREKYKFWTGAFRNHPTAS